MLRNKEIRRAIGAAGLKYWEVAEAMKMSESTFSRLLRQELTEEQKQTILEVIAGLEA